MRAVVIAKHGGLDVLELQERPDPSPGPGQLRVDVRAAGVNFADTLARVGLYPDAPKPPCVVGYEVAGTVSAVGDGVDDGRVGERVMAGTAFGGYASVVVPEADAVALPERLSFEEGAAVPVVYATASAGKHDRLRELGLDRAIDYRRNGWWRGLPQLGANSIIEGQSGQQPEGWAL